MRVAKALAAALTILNAAAFLFVLAPRKADSLKAVIRPSSGLAREVIAEGVKLVFKPFGEKSPPAAKKTEPIAAPEPAAAEPIEGPKEIPVDSASFVYMGRMNADSEDPVFFVKERATNRIFGVAAQGYPGALISSDDEGILFEIGGQRYETLR
jgi:hypothetical protein